MSEKSKDIAVIGMACYYPGARSPLELWENILTKRQQFRRMPDERLPLSKYYDANPKAPDKTYGHKAALIDNFHFDWNDFRIPKKTFEAMDIVQWLALHVALQALEDAGYDKTSIERDQCGVILGNTLTGEWTRSQAMRTRWPYIEDVLRQNAIAMGLNGDVFDQFLAHSEQSFKSVFPDVTEDTLAGGLSNTIAGRICNFLDLHGGGYTVDGACSSSLIAIIQAARNLANHDLDVAFAGGIDISLDTFELIGFAKTGALTPDEMRVYDKRANGFCPGEGCGFAILKRYEDAVRDGDTIYATIKGWGLSSDGKGGLTAPSVAGQAKAIREAYDMAGYSLADCDFVEGHGTGTTLGDKVEIGALADVYGQSPESTPTGMTSLKSIIGHTKAAAGIGAFIKAVIAVNRRVMPPFANCEIPNDLFSNEAQTLYPLIDGVQSANILRAGVSAMGFGGINTHVTLESGEEPLARLEPEQDEAGLMVSYEKYEAFPFSANTATDLQAQLAKAAEIANHLSHAELTDFAAELSRHVKTEEPFRACLIASRPHELSQALDSAQKSLAQGLKEGDFIQQESIFLSRKKKSPRIAFIYSGQASQKINMGRQLIYRHEWARKRANDFDDLTRNLTDASFFAAYDHPNFHQYKADDQDKMIRRAAQTEIAQPSICLVSALCHERLSRIGLKPQTVAGHSLGELTALWAAGALTSAELARFSALRGQLMSQSSNEPGKMAMLGCDQQTATELASQIDGYTTVAGINSPLQTVLSGDAAAIDQLVAKAQETGLRAQTLNVSTAFHSKLMRQASEEFGNVLKDAGERKLKLEFISGINGQGVGSSIALHDYLPKQILESVDFISTVRSILDSHDLVLEVGPGKALTNMIKQIGDDMGQKPQCYAIEACDSPSAEYKKLLAASFCMGASVKWTQVFADRLVRPFIDPRELKFIENPCERPITIPNAGDIAQTRPSTIDSFQQNQIVNQQASTPTLPATVNVDAAPGMGSAAPATPVANAGQPAVDDKPSAEQVIVAEVADITGFDPATIRMDLRILDDLNLDSIKAGELVANIALKMDLAGKVDFGNYMNASLQEIADAIAAAQQETGGNVAPTSTIDATATSVTSAANVGSSGSATHMASAKPAGDKPLALLSDELKQPWVRAMEESFIPRPDLDATVSSEAQSFLVAYTGDWQDLALSLTEQLNTQPSAATSLNLAENNLETILKGFTQPQNLIVLAELNSSDLDATIEQLQQVARLPRGPAIKSVSTLQFNTKPFGRSDDVDSQFISSKSWLASLALERTDISFRALSVANANSDKVDMLANAIRSALAQDDHFAAFHIDANGCFHSPELSPVEGKDLTPANVTLSKDDVIIVTGGAKGITAACAFKLAEKYHCRMALVGSSPKPTADEDSEINQTLKQFREAGLDADYFSCNLTQAEMVKELTQAVEKQMGTITGVVYGAGTNQPKPAQMVESQEAYRQVQIKVGGAQHMLQALDCNQLKYFVSLTSVIGVTGMPGNTWYALANENLDLLGRRLKQQHPDIHVCSLAYSVWAEIGMGAKLGSTERLAKMGISAIPPEKGVERFLQGIEYQSADQQRIIVSRMGRQKPSGHQQNEFASYRFLEKVEAYEAMVEVVTAVNLNTTQDSYLEDHNFNGTLLFPTVHGLEAMAQNVLFTLGRHDFEAVNIRNIELTKPITVGKNGTNIAIWTEVLERQSSDAPITVRAGIRSEKSGYTVDHFQAEFVFEHIEDEEFISFDRTSRPLGIDPKTDLYGRMLFQGPQFQRLKEIYHLESDDENEGMTIFRAHSQQDPNMTTVLGDPFFRDSLLQSAQLIIPRYQCLPIRIDRLRICGKRIHDHSRRYCHTDVHRQNEKEFLATITTVNEDGQVLEVMENYSLHLVGHEPSQPKAMELANKNKANTMNLRSNLDRIARRLDMELPRVTIIPKGTASGALFQEELQYLRQETKPGTESLKIETGRHMLHTESGTVYLNVIETHNEYLCISSPEGFRAANLQLLDGQWEPQVADQALYEKLASHDMLAPLDQGHQREARLKGLTELLSSLDLTDNFQLHVEYWDSHTISIQVDAPSGQYHLLSLHVLNGNDRIYTMLVTQNTAATNPLLEPYRGVSDVLKIDAEPNGPQDQAVFVHSFIPDFKAFSNLGRSIYFSHFFNWMGSARELSSLPVLDQVRALTETGQWGLVTNWASIKVLGECRNRDRIVQARMWCGKVTGKDESSVTLAFDWVSLGEDGIEERIAIGHMGFTWVEILGHGLVKPAPFPEDYRNFIESMVAKTDDPDIYIPAPEPLGDLEPGETLFVSAKGPDARPVLFEKTFETSLFDANLVGNLYFGNYSIWLGKARDFFFQSLMPDKFKGIGEQGEFRCTDCKIQHLREAMPFDEIKVKMCLSELYNDGMDLYFEFFKVNEDGSTEKLAYAEHRIVWTQPGAGEVSTSPLPAEVLDYCEKLIQEKSIKGAS